MNRHKELNSILSNGVDVYEFTVVFTRQLSDDLNCDGVSIADKNLPIGKALLNQFVNELQQVYDDCGMAGCFKVVSGPTISLGYNQENLNPEYIPIKANNKDLLNLIAEKFIGENIQLITETERSVLKLLIDSNYLKVDGNYNVVHNAE